MSKPFLYGVSTSAFQIEGDDGTQGRGISVWDTFCKREGVIYQGHDGVRAAGHYDNMEKDVRLMAQMNAQAYRFSTAWPRLLPDGVGKINQKGVDFYDRLIDELLKENIVPYLTMYHWDLPQTLSDKGGLQSEDFPKWFAEYAHLLVDKYGDRVNKFITFNEPINAVNSSYHSGVFAPALRLSEEKTMLCLHNMLLAHGEAGRILHTVKDAEVTIAVSTFEEYPATLDEETIEGARKRFFEQPVEPTSIDTLLDPVYFGKYPDRIYEKFPILGESRYVEDMKKIQGQANVIGYNNYSGYPVDKNGNAAPRKEPAPMTDMGNFVDPNGMYWGIKFLVDRYQKPVVITENGMACADTVSADGRVHDTARVDFLKKHTATMKKLIAEGVDIRGYFIWSFLDNFEWLFGYSKRFGTVFVDFDTLERIPKDSYYWYAKFIEEESKKK